MVEKLTKAGTWVLVIAVGVSLGFVIHEKITSKMLAA